MDVWPLEMPAKIDVDAQKSNGWRSPSSPQLPRAMHRQIAAWVQDRLTPHPPEMYTEAGPGG